MSSISSMDTRVTAMEEQINQMETNLKKGFESAMEALFQRLQPTQTTTETTSKPPGGELAGGSNE